jgi:hypothetical protein
MIGNIIDAIAKGYDQPSFRARVEQLESDKHQLESLFLEAEMKKEPVTVSAEWLQQCSSSFEKYIAQSNIPEIKKFISNFVESVVVNISTVDLNMCIWGLIDGGESPCIKAQIQKRQLLRQRIMKSLYAEKPRRNGW